MISLFRVSGDQKSAKRYARLDFTVVGEHYFAPELSICLPDGAVWWLVGLIIQRSQGQILFPLPRKIPAEEGILSVSVWPTPSFEALRESAAYLARAFDSPILYGQRYTVPEGFQLEAIPIAAANAQLLVQEAEAHKRL